MVQIVPIYFLVIAGNHETMVEAKDGEINGQEQRAVVRAQSPTSLNLSLYHY